MRRMFALFVLLTSATCTTSAQAPPTQHLYRTTLIQAAPGHLLQLIEQLKLRATAESDVGEPPTWIMRHSQGDKWDLLLLTPIGTYSEYFTQKRVELREKAARDGNAMPPLQLRSLIAWQEDVFVHGPPIEEVRSAITGGAFVHVEMFNALPGMVPQLRRQRMMENVYLKHLNRPENLIFTRDMGASWDVYTLGVYRDLKHYAESADIPAEKQEEAARVAGFQSAAQIGPYLRQFIRSHHDTLATAVR